ncbi:glycerate kinase [Parafrankia colletiae]|uniref:Glycerate kinase n=1 Tax=Parafrankia colletiae TaxID=573497 RepID=A0A1S1R3N0_9ACTN|nr:glycerate kinase [Parafrankia colletiae]
MPCAGRGALTIVVAPDSFKGTSTAADVAEAMAAGVRSVLGSTVNIVQCPLADGGEGTLDSFAASASLAIREVPTVDAIGRPRIARIGISPDGRLGVIEAAEANGLIHVSDVDLQPMAAHSYGVGLLARELLDAGVSEVLLCIGGTASNDGGTGFLAALGARFLDDGGHEVVLGASGLSKIRTVDLSGLHPRASGVLIRVAVDVDNPLTGASGAARVFGPQKGATLTQVQEIDAGLAQLAVVIAAMSDIDVTTTAGMGAAGGMPACLVGLLKAVIMPGSDLVLRSLGFAEQCENADLVITGEGAFDSQSLRGKVIEGVVRAVGDRCPIVVIAGRVALSAQEARDAGVTAALSIARGPATMDEMAASTTDLIYNATAHVVAMFIARTESPTNGELPLGGGPSKSHR